MPDALAASYQHCRRVARLAARNFYYGFLLLPAAKRDALCALYAFMRRADDISDTASDEEGKKAALAGWRAALDRALGGDYGESAVLSALHDTVTRYGIPPRYLHDLISGTEMDLTIRSYATFERLREYCYRVAGAVGLCCIHVFGFRDPRALELAEKLGIAFQLTNILRDVASDYALGRVYLPEGDLERFGVRREVLGERTLSPALRELLRFEAERAWRFYEEGVELLPLVSEDSRAALWALVWIYSGILARMERRGYDVLAPPPAGLSSAEKVWTLLRARLGLWPKDYGISQSGGSGRRAGGARLRRRAG
jgi:phytoene synthase